MIVTQTVAFYGHPTLPVLDESPAVGRYLGYSSEDILAAAERGARDGDDLGAQLVEAVCAAYVSMVQDSGPAAVELQQLRAQLEAERRINAQLRCDLAELTGDTLVVEVSCGG